MIRKMMMMTSALSLVALAQPVATPERAPVIPAVGFKLGCPTGTRQVGGPKAELAAFACLKGTADGLRVFHGPMVAFSATGFVSSVGQMEEGSRSGLWKFFDAEGNLVGITEFQRGDFHGRRVEFQNGKPRFEEHWVNGRRQGPQVSYDASGVATVTEYRDDRPVTK